MKSLRYPFRLGTTSYILPADILPNVRHLAGLVDDIELVLFEVDDGPSNLPSLDTIRELEDLKDRHGLSYTVHLPLDLRLASDGGEGHASLVKARKVIDRTRGLAPWAYVLHLDGREARPGPPGEGWVSGAVRALETIGREAGGVELLAVENLEGYRPDFLEPVFERVAASRCVDVGHLWLEGRDPLPFLRKGLPRARVIHLHGVGDRDHRSLDLVPQEKLRAVLGLIRERGYQGVLTLEVFGDGDFHSSREALERTWGSG